MCVFQKQRKEAELRREADRMAESIQREQQYVEAKQRTLEVYFLVDFIVN